MLKIIDGYPGSGKSTLMYEYLRRDIKNGRKAIFIVPEQQLVVTERRIADIIAERESLDVEVLSFRRLANRVFREYGGLCYNYLGKGADLLLMWRSLGATAPFLTLYGRTDPSDIGSIEALLSAKRMMTRGGIVPSELEKSAAKLGEEEKKLKNKLSDMALVFSAYEGILKQDFDDPETDLSRFCQIPGVGEFFKGKSVYLDAFNSLTAIEYSVIELIMKSADDLYVSVNYRQGEERDIFSKSIKYRKTLRVMADKFGIDQSAEYVDYPSSTIGIDAIKKELFKPGGVVEIPKDDNSIRIVKCPDKSTEVEWVFEDILEYVNNGGRYRDCVIAAGDISKFLGYIRGCSEKYNVPTFTSGRFSLISCSAIRSLRLLFRIINGGYPADDVIEYSKTGFSTISVQEGEILEKYVKTWNINGRGKWTSPWGLNPGGRRTEKSENAESLLEEINAIRVKLITPIEEIYAHFKGKIKISEAAKVLVEYLVKLEMPKKLKREAEAAKARGERMEAVYHLTTWKCIVSCLEIMESILGDIEVTPEVFARLFEAVINKNDVGQIPTTNDEVLTGNIDMLRISDTSRLYIIGLNDGEFPSCGEAGVFTDRECHVLDSVGIQVAEDSEQKLYDSLFSFYTLSASCRGRVAYTYSTAGKKKPSAVILRLKSMIEKTGIKEITAPNNSLSELMYLRKIENGLWQDVDCLGEENIKRLFDKKMILSQSKLDKFAHCPFSYAYSYILRLKEEKAPEISTDVFGTIIHLIFELFLKLAEGKEGGIKDISDEEAMKIIEKVTQEFYIESGCAEEDDIRIHHLFRRIRSAAFYLIRDLRGEFARTSYKPVGFEVKVGSGKTVEAPDITLDDGTQVLVDGVIDRVDSYLDKEGNAYIKIVDYKTGDRELSEEDIEKGYKLQLPLYMGAVCSSKSEELMKMTGKAENGKYVPAGMVYHIAKAPKKTEDPLTAKIARKGFLIGDGESSAAIGDFDSLKINKTLEEMEAILEKTKNKVRELAESIKSGHCALPERADSDTCAYCKMYPICRVDKNAINDKKKESNN